jgi:murein L,D-transpeptidase YafK
MTGAKLRGGRPRSHGGLGLAVAMLGLLVLAAGPRAVAGGSHLAALAVPRAELVADQLLVDKGAHRLTLWRAGKVLKSYRVALGRGGMALKARRGDDLMPEGRYRIDGRNAHSTYHRALHVSYPNAADIARARKLGVAPGGDVMIHGIRNGLGWIGPSHRLRDWTRGCIAVTDNEIEEIWRLVPVGTPIEIRP